MYFMIFNHNQEGKNRYLIFFRFTISSLRNLLPLTKVRFFDSHQNYFLIILITNQESNLVIILLYQKYLIIFHFFRFLTDFGKVFRNYLFHFYLFRKNILRISLLGLGFKNYQQFYLFSIQDFYYVLRIKLEFFFIQNRFVFHQNYQLFSICQ